MTLGPVLLALAGLVHPSELSAATAHRWVWLHIVLLPVFPLLALGLVVLLRDRPRAGAPRAARLTTWICAAVYAIGYTGLHVALWTWAHHGPSSASGPTATSSRRR